VFKSTSWGVYIKFAQSFGEIGLFHRETRGYYWGGVLAPIYQGYIQTQQIYLDAKY